MPYPIPWCCQDQYWEGGPAFFFMVFNVILCAESFYHLGEGEIYLGKLDSFRNTFFTEGSTLLLAENAFPSYK